MKPNDPPLPPLKERLCALAAFLPVFEDPVFVFGEWVERRDEKTGLMQMPFYSLSAGGSDFFHMAYDYGWVKRGFEWTEWKFTPEAEALRDDPECLSRATPDQIACLLTVVIRQDRFCEGELESAYEMGLLTAICRRAAQMESEIDDREEYRTS